MSSPDQTRGGVVIAADVTKSQLVAWDLLAEPGTWWTSAQRIAIAGRARRAFAQRALAPWLRELPADEPGLGTGLESIIDKVTLDAGSIDRAWATEATESIGDGHYVELIAIVATVVMIDIHAEASGSAAPGLPKARPGAPSQITPDGLGDAGAYVRMLDPFPAANVARALSLVPDANVLFRTVSVPTYSAPGFDSLTWTTPLSRPQVELIASRVAAINDCFY